MKPWYFLATLLLPCLATASGRVATVPEQFIGRWSGSPDSCESDADDLTLRITAHHIYFWESDGPVRAVEVRGDEIALIAELSGEGETWLSTAKFTLSSGDGTLTDEMSVPGRAVVRYKCPSAAGARSNNSFKPNPLRGSA